MLKERKKVELEDLARLVKQGFADVRSELSQKVDKVDIAGLHTDITSLQNDISRLAKATKLGFDEMDNKFEKLEERVNDRFDGVNQRLSNLDNRLDTFVTHEKRLVKVERELGFAV